MIKRSKTLKCRAAVHRWGGVLVLFLGGALSSCKEPESKSYSIVRTEDQSQTPLAPLPESTPSAKGSPALIASGSEVKPYNLANFHFPMLDGYFGSEWCACRGVGSSPHIGQDINADPKEEISVAVWDGTIDEVTFDANCGYAIWFRDEFGGLWRYLHLNKPAGHLVKGARVKAGAQLGVSRDFPYPGCGTGPHLHIELRERGQHTSAKPDGKNCGLGYSDCYFDPKIIKPGSPLAGASKSGAAALYAAPNDSPGAGQLPALRFSEDRGGDSVASLSVSESQVPSGCRGDLVPLPLGEPASPFSPAPADWLVQVDPQSDGYFRIEVNVPGRASETCASGGSGGRCVGRMQIFTVDQHGSWSQVADRRGLVGRDPDLSADHRVCTWPGAVKLFVVFETITGEQLVRQLRLPARSGQQTP
jgi:hypothetical protein